MDPEELKQAKEQRRREIEHQFRQTALKEVEGKTMAAKIWRLALGECDGDQERARERYVNLRVENLRHEYRRLAKEAVRMDREQKGRQKEASRYEEEIKLEKLAKRRSAKRKQGESDLTYIAIMIVVVAGIIAVIHAMSQRG